MKYNPALKGKVIDGATGEPLAGAVILREWNKHYATLAGGHGEFYDAQETVTDEKGEFNAPGKGLMFFTNVTKGGAYVFKAGYDWTSMDYEQLQRTGGIVRLRNLEDNMALMRKRIIGIPMPGGFNETKAYMEEIDKARAIVGLTP